MSGHICTPPGDSAEDILGVAYDLRCSGCVDMLVHMHGPMLPVAAFDARSAVERETIARVVAWLRRYADQPHVIEAGERLFSPMTRGALNMAAADIERGEWKGGE